MKKYLLFLFVALFRLTAVSACPACEAQQPKILQGITHGTGPDGKWDYVIVWVAIIIVLLTLFYSLKWLIHPGEKSQNHIKQFILNND